ncbi:ATP-binding protein [Luteolibacter algae]|uniref:ATP-binding protein n=1 Tax=Luteolibacter algae TaxID=454151 RepID=A0ABW5DE03_9BACT
MSSEVSDYEKLGQFYLGREYDLDSKKIDDDLVMYDSKDLVTHGVVLGMTGSGKTGLCIALLEEAAMDNIPAIVIDPKGDIANLMLTFPELDGQSFKPWINPDDAAKKGISLDEHAQKTAKMWEKGLSDWGQKPERIARFREKVDINIFTPGSSSGIPVSILSSLSVPPPEVLEDSELFGDTISSTVESLLSLIGISGEGTQSPEAVLLAAIFQSEWTSGRVLTLEKLIRQIQRPAFGKIGVIDLESFYPEKSRQTLALKFNSLLASPGFGTWLEGAPLDISKMLHRDDGKPRISIFSIAHLSDKERMFFVSLLLNQMLGWMRTQRGTTSLRALLYMDEIYGFLPPIANPPSKKPMMTMLKQGRAFGLGCLLATQNPVDLDYKALSNIGTWFLGRLQTERDKMRVLDGLEGAAGSQNARFNRKEMEILLSGLGNRVFLMNNVHEDGPVLFHVRWVMSYLTGPLSRGQIKSLMDDKRDSFKASDPEVSFPNPMARHSAGSISSARPVVGTGVVELFAEPDGDVYRPYLLREATVHFSLGKADVEGSRKIVRLNPIGENGIDWDETTTVDVREVDHDPKSGCGFPELPGYAMNAKNYKQVEDDFEDELYREEREEIWFCAELKAWGKIGEEETDFRVRISHEAREARDAEIGKLKSATQKKINALEDKLKTAEARLAKESAEANSAKMQAGISVLGNILKAVFGRKSGMAAISGRSSSSSISKATTAYKQHRDVANAEAKIEDIQEDIQEIMETLERKIEEIGESFDPSNLRLEKETIKPTRADVQVERIALLWK